MSGNLVIVVFASVFVLSLVAVLVAERPYADVEARFVKSLRRTRRSNTAGEILADIEPGEDDEHHAGSLAARRERLMRLVSARLAGEGFGNRLAQRLRRADLRLQTAEFMMLVAGLGAASLGLGWLAGRLLAGMLVAMVAMCAPFVFLNLRIAKRRRALEGQLADVLVLISNALRAGHSFLQAMDVVAREMPPPIKKEFEILMRETRFNIPIEDALRNLVERAKSADLDLAVTAMLIQRQVGGNMSEVIDKIAMTVRDRARLAAEVNAITATGRMSGWVVAGIPFVMVIIISAVNPEFMRPLFTHPIGWAAIALAGFMQLIGFIAISKVVNIKY